VRIDVTAADIDCADRSPWGCPVARALIRTVPFCEHAYAGHKAICYRVGMTPHDRRTPAEAREFMRRWDDGMEVEPFSFEIPD
jgi:hypothetical protein